jgi:hypothetical protein
MDAEMLDYARGDVMWRLAADRNAALIGAIKAIEDLDDRGFAAPFWPIRP